MMIDGCWVADLDRTMRNGAFVRADDAYDRKPDPATIAAISAGARRHVLVASKSCPWSHRVVLLRALKGFEDQLPLHIAGGPRTEGYALLPDGPLGDLDGGVPCHLHELYRRSNVGYTGRITVPLLWDRQERRIVCNNSARLMRSLDEVDEPRGFTLVPDCLLPELDALNADIYRGLSNAVYRAGLARTQEAYEGAVDAVFETLDRLEFRLSDQRFLFGNCLTECDLLLFATLVRFDVVYATHFRCTRKRLVDFPNLWAFARDFFQLPGIAETVDFAAILEGYYRNDGDHNPHGIVADRPRVDWLQPSGRECLGPTQVWLRQNGPADFIRPVPEATA